MTKDFLCEFYSDPNDKIALEDANKRTRKWVGVSLNTWSKEMTSRLIEEGFSVDMAKEIVATAVKKKMGRAPKSVGKAPVDHRWNAFIGTLQSFGPQDVDKCWDMLLEEMRDPKLNRGYRLMPIYSRLNVLRREQEANSVDDLRETVKRHFDAHRSVGL